MKIRIVCTIAFLASVACIQKCKSVDVEQTNQPPIDTTTYSCSGKTTCSEMKSCNEAKFYLENCPGVAIDGDRDGIPCEEQWCHN
jgi:hypothetical protein